jgi:hypothetical protein
MSIAASLEDGVEGEAHAQRGVPSGVLSNLRLELGSLFDAL